MWEEEARKHGEEWLTKYMTEAIQAAISMRAPDPLGLEPPLEEGACIKYGYHGWIAVRMNRRFHRCGMRWRCDGEFSHFEEVYDEPSEEACSVCDLVQCAMRGASSASSEVMEAARAAQRVRRARDALTAEHEMREESMRDAEHAKCEMREDARVQAPLAAPTHIHPHTL